MEPVAEDQLSDDEIFIKKLSLKEIKKRVLWNKYHDIVKCSAMDIKKEIDHNTSLKIIETHSEPNLVSRNKNVIESSHVKAVSNTSLSPKSLVSRLGNPNIDHTSSEIEQMVTGLYVTPKEEKSVELDNTLDVIDYILNNGPCQDYENVGYKEHDAMKERLKSKGVPDVKRETQDHSHVNPINEENVGYQEHDAMKERLQSERVLDVKMETQDHSSANLINEENIKPPDTLHISPVKIENKREFTTPCSGKNSESVFKTPREPVSHKKIPVSSMKKMPSKLKTYEHIASPVAAYINNSPVVPLLKDVRPRKPLPGSSGIPKFVKSQQFKTSNKENVNLPPVAYKSAKKTELINIPDENKMPQSQWAKKVMSSLPRPLVIKHDYREMNLVKRTLLSQQEDSFADLSLKQADVSICTQKTAFSKPPKKHL